MCGRRRQHARREPALSQRAKNFRRSTHTDQIHVPVRDPIESREKEQRSEVSVSAYRASDEGLSFQIADLLICGLACTAKLSREKIVPKITTSAP